MDRLKRLEDESLKIIRSIPQIAKRPAQLYSTGKDSTVVLHLARRAFEGRIPWKVVHIDTEKKPKQVYEFREKIKKLWNVPLIVIKNEEALKLGISPEKVSHFECCTQLKSNALKQSIQKYHWDSLIMSIRHDEHIARGMEDLLSIRNENGDWQWYGHFGGYGLTAPEDEGLAHLRIHPILAWTETDTWQYMEKYDLPVNPLYFSNGEKRFRSLGCECCTLPIESKAMTVHEILNEVYMTPGLERVGRVQDKEDSDTMLKLRQLGYL